MEYKIKLASTEFGIGIEWYIAKQLYKDEYEQRAKDLCGDFYKQVLAHYYTNTDLDSDYIEADYENMMKWLSENMQGEYRAESKLSGHIRGILYIGFEKETDAALFKLTWVKG